MLLYIKHDPGKHCHIKDIMERGQTKNKPVSCHPGYIDFSINCVYNKIIISDWFFTHLFVT